MTTCEICNQPLAMPSRGRRPRFCGGTCRVAAHRKEAANYIPAQLKERDRWILHKAKRPLALAGYFMSIHDDSNWLTYEKAASATVGDGIGLVLNGDGLVCIDLDDCVNNGKLNTEAQALIASLPKTFTEFSPSGRGVHIWGYADFRDGRRFERNGLKVEIYGMGRYITVTGKPIVKAGLAHLNLETLLT